MYVVITVRESILSCMYVVITVRESVLSCMYVVIIVRESPIMHVCSNNCERVSYHVCM